VCVPTSIAFVACTHLLNQFIAALAGASQATSFTGLMLARVVHGFASGVCEALPVQIVNDVFFLHERGKKIGYYTGIDHIRVYLLCSLIGSISMPMSGSYRTTLCRLHVISRLFLASILLRRSRLLRSTLHLGCLLRGRVKVPSSATIPQCFSQRTQIRFSR